MPNPTLSDVLEEAYASADPDQPIIPTISIYSAGLGDDLFIFDGFCPTIVNGDGTRELEAKIEATAARHAGETVTFMGLPFAITVPETTVDPVPRASLSVSNITRETIDLLIEATQSNDAVTVVWREYVVGNELVGPENDPPITFSLVEVSATPIAMTGRLVTLNVGSRRFPFQRYSATRFPALQYS